MIFESSSFLGLLNCSVIDLLHLESGLMMLVTFMLFVLSKKNVVFLDHIAHLK